MKSEKSLLLHITGKQALCHALDALLLTIFSCTTSIIVSRLHFGQYTGKLIKTVSAYTLVRDRFPQIGHGTQWESFIFASMQSLLESWILFLYAYPIT